MLNQLKTEANYTNTENGALAYYSTGNACLDLFSAIGALRNASDEDIIARFARAYIENKDTAMKILFYARDVRGGLGERRVFRVIMRYLSQYYPDSVVNNVENVAEYGRYDDLLTLLFTPVEYKVIALVREQLKRDIAAGEGEVSLLAKWLPSVNTSSVEARAAARYLAEKLDMTYAQYRKTLSGLRAKIKIIENNLREKDYTFDYQNQTSRSLLKYRAAFIRNDAERYAEFLEKVNKGEANMNVAALYPYDVVNKCFSPTSTAKKIRNALDTTWNEMVKKFRTDGNKLVVCDGSGSMYGYGNPLPIAVAISLSILFAEGNEGEYKNHFITFSEKPRLVEIKGKDIYEKVMHCAGYNEVANTDLGKVFELLLKTAIKHKVPQSEMPETLYIISDMEFDYCVKIDKTVFEYAKESFENAGYKLPTVVFWNVQARNRQVPVTENELGVALVSGASPSVFKIVMENVTPLEIMNTVLSSDRYKNITA